MLEQMDNPLCNNTGLATSRARDYEQRSITVFDRPKLFRVELQHKSKLGLRRQESGSCKARCRCWLTGSCWKREFGMQRAAQVVFLESRIPNPESYPFLRNQATTMITPSQILTAES
jgi:hypothetical protein